MPDRRRSAEQKLARSAEGGVLRAEWVTREAERNVVAEVTRTVSDLVLVQERIVLAREVLRLTAGSRWRRLASPRG